MEISLYHSSKLFSMTFGGEKTLDAFDS